jgi:hypothetical protein
LATLALLLVMAMLAGCGDDDGGSEEIYQPYDTAYINSVLPTRAFCDAQGYRQENDYSLRYYFLLDSCQLRLWADFIVDSKWQRGYEPPVLIDGVSAFELTLQYAVEISPKIKDLYWVDFLMIQDSDSLRAIPSEVFELDSLHILWMERLYGLESFPVPVKAASNLETLFIRDVSARNVPDEYWDVPWQEVFLSGIDLLAIPSGIEKLKTLKKLGVMGNAIERIPDFILNMNNLIAFDASVNSINMLPRGWCEWQIKSRDVRNNKLCNLPDSLWTCVDAMNQKPLQECE